ncbi:MAG: hypothetical protein V3S01_03870 [Dehalococcoidia bacterium]
MMAAEQGDEGGRDADRMGEASGGEPIELEQFQPIETPGDVAGEGGGPYTREQMPAGPVPASPLHLCPTCDYILTGLTSRRCPECGDPFTVDEARRRAVDQSPAIRRMHRAALANRWAGVLGAALLVGAVLVLNLGVERSPPWVRLRPSAGGATMLVLAAVILLFALMAKSLFDSEWSHLLLIGGLVAAFGVLVLLLL